MSLYPRLPRQNHRATAARALASVLAAAPVKWYDCSTTMRFSFDPKKSGRLRANSRRGIGFEEARELFRQPYYLDRRSDSPESSLLQLDGFEAACIRLCSIGEEIHLYEANQ